MSIAALDIALRAASVALLLVLAASLFRDARHAVSGRLAVAFALGSAAHAATAAFGPASAVSVWHAPLIALWRKPSHRTRLAARLFLRQGNDWPIRDRHSVGTPGDRPLRQDAELAARCRRRLGPRPRRHHRDGRQGEGGRRQLRQEKSGRTVTATEVGRRLRRPTPLLWERALGSCGPRM